MAQQRLEQPDADMPYDWRVPQEFSGNGSFAVRDELLTLLRWDLLGPWRDDQIEAFDPDEPNPREKYLVGLLGPKRVVTDSRAPDGELAEAGADADGIADDGELPVKLTAQDAGKIWASSMGLNFLVEAGVDVLCVTASWGRYARTSALDDEGVERRTWSREPVSHDWELRLSDGASQKYLVEGASLIGPCVYLQAEIRGRAGSGASVVQVSLVNALDEPSQNKDECWLFQTKITVTALDGDTPIFTPITLTRDDQDDVEEAHLDLLYRNALRFANGHNVAVHAALTGDGRRACRLETTWLPVHDVPSTLAPADEPGLTGLVLSMDELAELDAEALRRGLESLAAGYSAWLADRKSTIPSLPTRHQAAARAAVEAAETIAARITAGIDVLTSAPTAGGAPGQALAAFRFANEAMAMQRRHTQISALRATEGLTYQEATDRVERLGVKAASWRPFQLAFVLLNIGALADPAHGERRSDPSGLVDLLFFPAGGGKTEAYLGLTAFAFALRRLQGVVGQEAIDAARAAGDEAGYRRARAAARDGRAGVAVLMRYTLRLLTAQQFQRAATLVCACEILRRQAAARGDNPWGERPFRIGMWVGNAVAPNWYSDAADQISQAKQATGRAAEKRANVLQTKSCPWCGQELSASGQELRADSDRRRILLYCARGEEDDPCPFSRLGTGPALANGTPGADAEETGREGLPILTVDEEIYRYLPDLVIATVDKMAQLPWKGYAGMLFGRVGSECERHGYQHADLDRWTGCTSSHHAVGAPGQAGSLAAARSQAVPFRLRPPDLIIQDELHLISGALGTSVGLFEMAVDALCAWPVLARDGSMTITGPKIVASTATTKRARAQVRGVFGRDLALFPPPVLEVTDTFFSRQIPLSPTDPGRRYLGVCAHGTRFKAAQMRVAEILLLAGQDLFNRHGAAADPYMTLVGYFNATKELAGMRRYLDDDVSTRVRINGPRKGLANRLLGRDLLRTQELTSRISSADITAVLRQLEVAFDPEQDTTVRRLAIRRELEAARKAKPKRRAQVPHRAEERRPVDVVLATSMLQVGVDVSRFGLMLVTGQPKNTAEYIQASSRVGRQADKPGLVVTLYNWSRPRDLAHFEDFEHYHATFYRQVEALSVTPFAPRALDRGATGALIAALRNIAESHSRNTDAQTVRLNADADTIKRMRERFLERAESVGGPEARADLDERLTATVREWSSLQGVDGLAIGYRDAVVDKQPISGILQSAGEKSWSTMTVAQSMRETENEINLLLPADGIFDPIFNTPDWNYGATPAGQDDDEDQDEDAPFAPAAASVEF